MADYDIQNLKFLIVDDDTNMCHLILIEKIDTSGPGEIEAIKVHIDAMKLVIGEDMKGQGGKAGEEMLAGLQKVCDKLVS